jgi:hypothetical protein
MPYPHVPWTKITQLHNVVKRVQDEYDWALQNGEPAELPTRTYKFKTKLHGTNAAVRITDGVVQAQSRSRVLSTDSDNAGFAHWVTANKAYFEGLGFQDVVIFGEWCGQGIQSGVAIAQIGRKVLCVYALVWPTEGSILVEPGIIASLLPEHPDVFVLPWEGTPLTLDHADRLDMARFTERVVERVEQVEACDAWVAATFGPEGVGEGYVAYPVTEASEYMPMPLESVTKYMFKAKGQKHSASSKVKKTVRIDAEVVATVGEFAELFVTEERLQQGVLEGCEGETDMTRMGDFIKWMCKDVHSESEDEVTASGLEWRALSRGVVQASKTWYAARVRGSYL